jgi:serine/threonine protein kinase
VIGTVIDRVYRIERVIGEGSFGVVYLCTETPLDRRVAVKMLAKEKSGGPELKRFLAEGRHLASLNHPNVVQIYRFGSQDEQPYIVMEYVEGQTLRDAVRKGPLPLDRALRIMRQVAAGLRTLHERGILHHDLSCGNVMVDVAGTAKILDLGLARDVDALSSASSQNMLIGTLAYVAPEQIEGKGTGVQAEIFSFGVMLYEVLTGRNPFWAEHHMSILYNIAHREPERLERRVENCPPELARLVHACLAKRPEDRPASMAEVEAALADLAGDTPAGPVPVMRTASVRLPAVSTSRNPYLNRTMIKHRDDFFGRSQEIRRIYARLNATPPGSISVVGDRKIGKSSLLNYIYMRANRQIHLEAPDQTVMVFLDLQEQKDMAMESFVRRLLAIASYELRSRLDIQGCSLDLDGVKDLVQRLEGGGFRLVLLLDEFDAVTTNSNFGLEFFSFLRYLANHYNVAYVTSSARELQTLCHTREIADSPFFNIFSNLRLSVFRRDEAAELIRVPSERVGTPLEPHTDRILDMSGLFPFFIQMACAHAIEWIEDNPEAATPDFAEIQRRFYEEARFHYRSLWESFDAHERSAIQRIAAGRSIPDSLRHVLQDMGSKHYVESEDGRSRLFASTFRDFVRAEAERSRAPSFLDRVLGRRR